jgi:hypothetical protein
MTDELTPEEKEAFKNLPRERMPVGLEPRVVAAMRERGFLAKRGRTIDVTNGRLAGVLAASVALMIGAYSIGLHRGGKEVPAPLQPVSIETPQRAKSPAETRALGQTAAQSARETEGLVDTDKKGVAEVKSETPAAPAEPAARPNEAVAGRDDRATSREVDAAARSEPVPSQVTPIESPRAVSKASGVQPPSASLEAMFERRSLTILLDGSPLTVEADSVRVTADERGRILIIYTSDGTIRIRLTD